MSAALLVILVATPGLAAVCAATCATAHESASVEPAGCHAATRSTDRMSGTSVDPCGTHETTVAEPFARPLSQREHDTPTVSLVSILLSDTGAGDSCRPAVVTPRPTRPGPSRPPLVLRV